jgi:hypothetical protein
MKRDLCKQNLRLIIHLKHGKKIANIVSDKNIVEDIDDDFYYISMDLTKNKKLNAQHYESINKGLDAIDFIEIKDDNAVKIFKDYYITRYSNNKKAYLKNVLVNLIMGQTKTIKCDVEVEKVLRLCKVG